MERIDSALLDQNGATAFFARELEVVKARTYDIKYPQLSAANGELFPISYEAGPGAETITYEVYDMTGIAKIIANYADDLPLVNVAARSETARIRSIGNAYVYSLQDIRAAMMAGRSLTDRMAMAARRANDQLVNHLIFVGDDEYNIVGLLNNSNIPEFEVTADGAGSLRTFASKIASPDKILRDMNEMESRIVASTKGVERPDTLLMPVAQYQLIATTPRTDGTDTTILDFFLKNSIGIKTVKPVHELKAAGDGGVDIMIAYNNDPEHLTVEIPQPFEQLPVQEKNLSFTVPCHSRFGGLIVYYPLAVIIGEGI